MMMPVMIPRYVGSGGKRSGCIGAHALARSFFFFFEARSLRDLPVCSSETESGGFFLFFFIVRRIFGEIKTRERFRRSKCVVLSIHSSLTHTLWFTHYWSRSWTCIWAWRRSLSVEIYNPVWVDCLRQVVWPKKNGSLTVWYEIVTQELARRSVLFFVHRVCSCINHSLANSLTSQDIWNPLITYYLVEGNCENSQFTSHSAPNSTMRAKLDFISHRAVSAQCCFASSAFSLMRRVRTRGETSVNFRARNSHLFVDRCELPLPGSIVEEGTVIESIIVRTVGFRVTGWS